MLKIKRSHDRLIFDMGIPYLVKTVLILRRGPGSLINRIMRINTRSTMIFFETSSTDLNDIIGIWLLQNDKNTKKITENMLKFAVGILPANGPENL